MLADRPRDPATPQAEEGNRRGRGGTKIVERLSADLRAAFPGARGFSVSSLRYMRAFAAAWPEREMLQSGTGALPRGHIMLLLDKLSDRPTRDWYAARASGWSVGLSGAELEHHIASRLHERQAAAITPAFSADELSRPLLELPGREYLLFSGPLSAATRIGDPHGVLGFDPQSPNLMWPSDRAWFLGSEIDFDSTLVGGTRDLIESILDTSGLDAWPVGPDDSLAYDADRINLIHRQHETTGREGLRCRSGRG